MSGAERTSGFLAHLVLAVLLVTAQAGVALHAFEHDAGVPQVKTCQVCVTAAQLAAASVANAVPADIAAPGGPYEVVSAPDVSSHKVIITRQRGPPPPL